MNASAIGTFTLTPAHNDIDRENLLELCELAGVPMSRDLLNTLHALLSSPLNVSPIALFHVLKEALANQSVVEGDSANATVEVTGVVSRRKAQTPQ